MKKFTQKIVIREFLPKMLTIFGLSAGYIGIIYAFIDGLNKKKYTLILSLIIFILFAFVLSIIALFTHKNNKIKEITINEKQISIKYIKDNKKNTLLLDKDSISSSRLEVYLNPEMQGHGNILYESNLFINTKDNDTYKIMHYSTYTEGLKKIFLLSEYLPKFQYKIDAFWTIKKFSFYHIDEVNNIAKTGRKNTIKLLINNLRNEDKYTLQLLLKITLVFIALVILLILTH